MAAKKKTAKTSKAAKATPASKAKPKKKVKASTGTRSSAAVELAGDDVSEEWLARMGKFSDGFRKYSTKHEYNEGEGIEHKEFGKGFVVRTQPRKMEVVFEDRNRLLVQKLQ